MAAGRVAVLENIMFESVKEKAADRSDADVHKAETGGVQGQAQAICVRAPIARCSITHCKSERQAESWRGCESQRAVQAHAE